MMVVAICKHCPITLFGLNNEEAQNIYELNDDSGGGYITRIEHISVRRKMSSVHTVNHGELHLISLKS